MIPNTGTKPPGKKMLKNMPLRTKWLLLLPVSLVLVSGGLVVLNAAGNSRHSGEETRVWGLLMVYALVLLNGGLLLFGQAIYYRVMMDVRKETRRSIRQMEKKIESKANALKRAVKKTKNPTKTN
jgi:hypothetical protein